MVVKVSKGAKISNRYNQVPHLTQDTDGKVTNSQLDNTNESQEVSPFPAGDHKAHINRRTQRHSKHKAFIVNVNKCLQPFFPKQYINIVNTVTLQSLLLICNLEGFVETENKPTTLMISDVKELSEL